MEGRLVRRAREGDAEAYGELARRQARPALRVATVVLGTSQGADDVVQQALERAWRSLHAFDPQRPFRPWLLQIVANTARNDRRARGRRAELAVRAARRDDAAGGGGWAAPEEHVVLEAERRWVLEALNRLGADDRLVIGLRYFEQLSERDMAEALGCPAGTVKSRLSRAMARLRAELARNGEPGEVRAASARPLVGGDGASVAVGEGGAADGRAVTDEAPVEDGTATRG